MSLFTKRPADGTERLRELLAENLPRSHRGASLKPANTLREIGMTSLGLLLVITRFCEEFDIPMNTLKGNLGDLVTIEDLLAEGKRILESQHAPAAATRSVNG